MGNNLVPLYYAIVKHFMDGRQAVSYTHLDVYKRQAYACALGRLMDDEDERARMSAASHRRADAFSEDAIYEKWKDVYKRQAKYLYRHEGRTQKSFLRKLYYQVMGHVPDCLNFSS